MMQKCDIDVFGKLPPYKSFKTEGMIKNLPKAFELFYQSASDVSYRSQGELRREETHCIFHYTVKGHGRVTYKGKDYTTAAGQGFFNVINERNSGYGYPLGEKEPWQVGVICFDGGNTRQIVAELLEKQVVYSLKEQEIKLAKMCTELCNGETASITFLSELVEMITESSRGASETVERFNAIVQRQLEKNPTVSNIALEMNVTREHLTRIYTELSGESPAKYIKRKRFEMLCALLSSGARLERIAKQMSFPSVSGMGVFFKSISSVTITEYRKNGYLSI
jgi:AraC-like DNA-binding protein